MSKEKKPVAERCPACAKSPVVGKELTGTDWFFRHECDKTGKVFDGRRFELEESAIVSWNKTVEKEKSEPEKVFHLSDPYVLASSFVGEAMRAQVMARKLMGSGKQQAGQTMMLSATIQLLRSDIWYQIFIDKCYREGMEPSEIFAPPVKESGAN